MPKKQIRKTLLARRAALSETMRYDASQSIQAAVVNIPEYYSAGSVAMYIPIRGEVDTGVLLADALVSGKKVYLPVVGLHGLLFRQIFSTADLVPGAFGIAEPHYSMPAAAPEEIDLFLLPGVGFDLNGHRVGYGKGFYDKTLHRMEGKGCLFALAYEVQIVESLASEGHDVRVDRIITERRVIMPTLLK